MDHDHKEPDQMNNTKNPIRRRYEVAFSDEEADVELEEHIVPEPTTAVVGVDENDLKMKSDKDDRDTSRFSCQVPSCVMTFSTAGDYQAHYNARHMHSCSICRKNLPSSHILELHVLELHDTLFSLMAEKKPMYQCFLESCSDKFMNAEVRKEHCIMEHKFSQKFHYWDCNPPRNHGGRKSNSVKSSDKSAAKAKGKSSGESSELKNPDSSTKANKSGDLLMDVDLTSSISTTVPEKSCDETSKANKNSNGNGDTKPSRSMPKHIAFGRAPHRAFQNAYTSAIDPNKGHNKGVRNVGDNNNSTLIDMKDVEAALVTSSETDANTPQ